MALSKIFAVRAAFTLLVSVSMPAAMLACAPSLSSMEGARVVGKYHTRVYAGYEVQISTGAIGSVIDAGKTIAHAADSRMPAPRAATRFASGVKSATRPCR